MTYKNITSFKIACEVLKKKPNLPDVSKLSRADGRYLADKYKLTTIIAAMNFVEGKWKPDWSDHNQYKYFAWPEIAADKKHPSGFGFSDSAYDYGYAGTAVGSRLCFKSSEMALWALKKYKNLYITVLLK
jgi:hypothetical protein